MKALVIVDVQNDFLKNGSLEVPRANNVIEPINQIINNYPLVVATKDWHPLDHNLNEIKTKYKQGIFSTTLDDLFNNWKLPQPNYLKIDVDGIEFKIISKSNKILLDNKLKSVLIEINPHREEDKSILKTMADFNFSYSDKQVDSSTRKSGPHKGYAEYLFYKK